MFQKIELAFEIGFPANETQFSKKAITKNDSFFMLILVNINGNRYRQDRCVL